MASDILDVKTISICLPGKLASGNKKPPAKAEFLLVCGWWATVSVEPWLYVDVLTVGMFDVELVVSRAIWENNHEWTDKRKAGKLTYIYCKSP